MTVEILTVLVRVNAIAGAAIVLVLLLRPLALRFFGARVAYWLWLVVPLAVAAGFLPARERIVVVPPPAFVLDTQEAEDEVATSPSAPTEASATVAATSFVSLPALADVLVAVWLLGAATLFARSIASTRRLAADPSVGPALVGVLKPKLVLPADFESRFDAQERALILAHETVHRVSGHTVVNGLVELARCASWFNPLVHVAALRIRADQELACDAAVVAARPTERRAYAQALLKTQIAPAFLRLGCTWTSPSAKRIGERIAMLGRPSLSRRAAVAGASTVAAIGLAVGYAAWAQQPEGVVTQMARPQAVWTPTAAAPPGTLSHALEGQRHDLFIELAQKGDIDLVFFGTTETEQWWWNAHGRAVWDREYAGRKAQNFGSQGTNPKSLLWRMQNGELDGYEAKLIVIQLVGTGRIADPSSPNREPEFLAGWSAVLAEIRARQPQARILLLAGAPRGIRQTATRTAWREVADANAAVVQKLTDDETVFYADFGERFFLSDGSYNRDYWGIPGRVGVGVGMQPAAFEIWAEELKPWIERFVG
jgi:beta-lactamase regulating signal transducer with metallopeptidase domain